MTEMKPEHAADNSMVAAFYKFVALPDYQEFRATLLHRCEELGLLGSILLAAEGINGTISGLEEDVLSLFEFLRSDPRLHDLQPKVSWAGEQPFYRMKVRLKKEIVTLGVAGTDPNARVGEYVPPGQWNELISRDDVRVVDTRNHLANPGNSSPPGAGLTTAPGSLAKNFTILEFPALAAACRAVVPRHSWFASAPHSLMRH
jgi:UPF0176 protein